MNQLRVEKKTKGTVMKCSDFTRKGVVHCAGSSTFSCAPKGPDDFCRMAGWFETWMNLLEGVYTKNTPNARISSFVKSKFKGCF